MATINMIPGLEKVESSIRGRVTWEAGWNGYGAPPPNTRAVEHALGWMRALYNDTLDLGLSWIEPNVTASADGEVVFEWWAGGKKLTVYVGDGNALLIITHNDDEKYHYKPQSTGNHQLAPRASVHDSRTHVQCST